MLDAAGDLPHSLDMPAANISDATRSAFPALTAQAEFAATYRGKTFYARRVAKYPATLAGYVDYAFGTAPRAASLKTARAACMREFAALVSNPTSAAELEAAYLGG